MPVFVRTQEIEHPIGPAGRFTLRVTSPDVMIKGTEDSVARVRVTLELRAASETEADELMQDARFRVREGDGSLEVSEPRHDETGLKALARLITKDRFSTEGVEVRVPHGAELEFDGVSADVTATGLDGNQRYRTVSGDLVLDRVGGAIRVQGVSADVSLQARTPVSFDANTVSGDLSVFAPAFDSLRVVTVSGDVEAEGVLDPSAAHRVETVSGDFSLGVVGGLTLEVRGLSGDADINLPHRAEGSRDRRRYIVGGGEAQLLFSSMSGDVSVGSPRRSGSIPPIPPIPPVPPVAPRPPARPALSSDEQLAVLQALERGEIDVDQAARRLAGEIDV